MRARLRFLYNRISERLWVRPLLLGLLSIAGAFMAQVADQFDLGRFVPDISADSLETLLKTISASMLVIATFSVSSMVAAYASASGTATPRSFPLVIADDSSQNALSTFVGAFIFSIVALIAMLNSYYDKAGRFALFVLTLFVFAVVILTFVRWVDSVARLGRLGATVDKVEKAASAALRRRRSMPTLGGVPAAGGAAPGEAITATAVGYVQHVDMAGLQACAEQRDLRVTVAALPGFFAAPGRPLAGVEVASGVLAPEDRARIAAAFTIGGERVFDEDPRFGLVALSEIASRALSPAVNDPGTAIDIIGTMVRLFVAWTEPVEPQPTDGVTCDRVAVPELALHDMFDDAFAAIARDGAGTLEVVVRLMKALEAIAATGHPAMRANAMRHAQLTLKRAEGKLDLEEDREIARHAARFAFAH